MAVIFDFNMRLQKMASPLLLAGLFLLMFALGVYIVSPIGPSEELMALAGGQNVPDAQFWREPDAFYGQLAAYGDAGRSLYLTQISRVDLLIPLAQALFLSVAISLGWRGHRWFSALPFLAMLADYLENASLATLFLAYPARLDGLAMLAGGFTVIKFLVSLACLGIALAGAALGMRRAFLTRRLASQN